MGLKLELNEAAENEGRPSHIKGSHLAVTCRYLVTHLMGADLNNIVKCQKLTDDHVQFLIYQILRGLKVSEASTDSTLNTFCSDAPFRAIPHVMCLLLRIKLQT